MGLLCLALLPVLAQRFRFAAKQAGMDGFRALALGGEVCVSDTTTETLRVRIQTQYFFIVYYSSA